MDRAIPRQARQAERYWFRPSLDGATAESFPRAQEAEGATFATEFAEPCGHCGRVFHPDCATCVAGGGLAA